MKRNDARRIAVCLAYSCDLTQNDTESVLNQFFSDEHYSSLQEENEIFSVYPDSDQMKYISQVLTVLTEHLYEIDELISRFSETRKVERISKTALAVLRCAISEMLFIDDIPESVSINEAVNISKEFDSPDTVSFINGVLGSISRNIHDAEPAAE